MRYFSQVKNIEIIGVTEDYQDTANITMAKGSFINDRDTFSAVAGAEVADGKFRQNISIRSTIEITFRLKKYKTATRSLRLKVLLRALKLKLLAKEILTEI